MSTTDHELGNYHMFASGKRSFTLMENTTSALRVRYCIDAVTTCMWCAPVSRGRGKIVVGNPFYWLFDVTRSKRCERICGVVDNQFYALMRGSFTPPEPD